MGYKEIPRQTLFNCVKERLLEKKMEDEVIENLRSILISLVWIIPLVCWLPDVGNLSISIGCLGFDNSKIDVLVA